VSIRSKIVLFPRKHYNFYAHLLNRIYKSNWLVEIEFIGFETLKLPSLANAQL